MLTIQKFAALAGTTRRTLIFYDEKNLFKPKKIATNGYRYYAYDQLYTVTFILALRRLGLPIAEIKQLTQTTDATALNAELKKVQQQLEAQMDNLTILRETLNTRFNQSVTSAPVVKNHPFIETVTPQSFCRSRQSVACTDAEIAEIYAEFYTQLGQLKLMDQQDSGFLTQLPNSDANGYSTASFCILKAISPQTATGDLPLIQKPAGEYLSIDTTNDLKGICISLQLLSEYIQKNDLKITDQLWQMNLDEHFTTKGASPIVRLQYQLQSNH